MPHITVMSLPAGFLDDLRTRTSLSQVVGRKVIWDTRKSNQAKGDMWAPCPFHQEKTASFHVDDRKGFYYCFGCHAKGDAISFVRETENVDFMEAVQILAHEAGMPMPERDPQAQAKADHRDELAEVMEMAVRHFRLRLQSAAGGAARDYLEGRGLNAESRDRFEIGFAPAAWQDLWDHLTGRGVTEKRILACGLAKPGRKNGRPYDTFRGRIMFPIRDPRGRCIAFGGRALDPEEDAKYLNSSETELFDKSRTLYNHGPAREAAGKGQPLIVAEGYMDVITLGAAGFDAAVAPLGTALTEAQLAHLWRISDEPVIALDGDEAGLRAAHRVIDTALPLLEAGKSLRFAILPENTDPDDLIRAEGPAAVRALVGSALPMVQLLWQRETAGRSFDSPERRAALDQKLRAKIGLIRDPSIRSHYGQAIKDLRWKLFNPRQGSAAKARGGRWQPIPGARAGTKSSLLVTAGDGVRDHLREAVILATLAGTPEACGGFESGLETLECRDATHARLRDLLLLHANEGKEVLEAAISAALGTQALEKLRALPHVAITPAIRRPGDAELARKTVAEELEKIAADRGLKAEVSEAAEDLSGVADEAVTWRLSEAARVRDNALRSIGEDRIEYETGDNGARMNRREREAFENLLGRIGFDKPGS